MNKELIKTGTDTDYSTLTKEFNTLNERVLIFSSLILLFISCVDGGLAGNIAKLLWLLSLAIVSVMNFGGAFGLYVFSVAIYNAKHVWAPGPILDRVDNFALIIILLVPAFTRIKRHFLFKPAYLIGIISLFIFSALFQAKVRGLLNWYTFAEFMRTFGLPFSIYLLLRGSSRSIREIRPFWTVIIILGIYMAVISILEQGGAHSIVIPNWIGDPALNRTIGSGRSGGPLLQSEFNGFALGLIYCIALLNINTDRMNNPLIKYIVCTLYLVGIFFTYTRAAWFAVVLGSFCLLFRPSAAVEWKVLKRVSYLVSAILLIALVSLFPGKTAKERTGDVGTVYYRINLWTAGVKMAIHEPLFGHGLGRFEKDAPDYQGSLRSVPEIFIPAEGTGAHHIFINLFVEQGILGLALYILIMIQIYREANTASRSLFSNTGSIWVLAFTVVYLVNAQFVNIHEPVTNLIYFGTMGLIAGSRHAKINKGIF